MTCPHCPDGHTPPDGGSQPWAAYLGPERDGDGQPTTIHVGRTGGAHVAESDAQWIRDRLNHRPASTAPSAAGSPLVRGYCPACRGASLFLGEDGYVTCARLDCPDPSAATDWLEQRDKPDTRAAADDVHPSGDDAAARRARYVAAMAATPWDLDPTVLDDLAAAAITAADQEAADLRQRAEQRLTLAHKARRAKEHQLDDIRRALCDAGHIHDDDPYSHADLADVIRQTAAPEEARP
ncbi:DUF6085 family protein [Streptomyces sp. WMMC897]|uniref:DUF6085 family protein n=1 Tax=Streptomyces sp. WMMC897 TaxID=3014782 RepID=UPI0022B6214E|nr:DUF6085 family protein [Streptomyces sp. WMMC897]MCZ7413131.1 DUF6085 family protein [Streptomyces sp. WMMC897]MCZ7415485.1 DUF6085 family protein [Streptomyces sp. WMMC897]